METLHAAIDHIENWIGYIESTQHSRLKEIAADLNKELEVINQNKRDHDLPMLRELTESFKEVKKEVLAAIERERTDIFKKIRTAIRNIDNTDADEAYHSLSSPVRQLIMDHHRILDKIQNLLPLVTALGYKGLTKDEHLKMYMDLFEFYNSYNKLVYVEENMVFPAIVAVFERKEEWYG